MAVLHASGSGWFPFCPVPATGTWDGTGSPALGQVGPGTLYPVGLSLAQAMRWYWQVQTWQLASDLDFSGTQAAAPFAFHFSYAGSVSGSGPAPQEARTCPATVLASSDPLLLTLWGAGLPLYVQDGLYYPALRLRAQDTNLTVSSYKPDAAIPKPWPQSGSWDGMAIPLWYDEAGAYDGTGGGTGDRGPWTQTCAGTMTVTATALF